MALQKWPRATVEEEAHEEAPTITQHHDKRHQLTLGPTDLKITEVTPVNLSLLPRQGV